MNDELVERVSGAIFAAHEDNDKIDVDNLFCEMARAAIAEVWKLQPAASEPSGNVLQVREGNGVRFFDLRRDELGEMASLNESFFVGWLPLPEVGDE